MPAVCREVSDSVLLPFSATGRLKPTGGPGSGPFGWPPDPGNPTRVPLPFARGRFTSGAGGRRRPDGGRPPQDDEVHLASVVDVLLVPTADLGRGHVWEPRGTEGPNAPQCEGNLPRWSNASQREARPIFLSETGREAPSRGPPPKRGPSQGHTRGHEPGAGAGAPTKQNRAGEGPVLR